MYQVTWLRVFLAHWQIPFTFSIPAVYQKCVFVTVIQMVPQIFSYHRTDQYSDTQMYSDMYRCMYHVDVTTQIALCLSRNCNARQST